MTIVLALLTVGLVGNAVRLRLRLGGLARLEPSTAPVHPAHVFVTARGVEVPDPVRHAASAHAVREDLRVLELVPSDLPTERTLDLARMVDPATFRTDVSALGRGAFSAFLVHEDVLHRMGRTEITGLDPVEMLRLNTDLKRYASSASDVVAAPIAAGPFPAGERRAFLGEMFSLAAPIVLLVALVELLLLAAAPLLVAPLWAAAALVAYSFQPFLATAGAPVTPRDLLWRCAFRLPLALVDWVRTVAGPRRLDGDDPVIDLRFAYHEELERGVERFLEERRPDCPMCGSTDLTVFLRSPDLQQRKPGVFTLERCGSCRHIFQNPRLSLDGLDFYYRDFYDGLGEDQLEFVFGAGGDSYRGRAEAIEGIAEPRRWLDVGTGHGHFCLLAREVWPDTIFDGLDLSESVEEAERRGWVDRGFRGLFPDLAPQLRGRYDVVSMHHYLEHTREPLEELDAAARVVAPGGHLLIEVPDPECRFGRLLGRFWVPWFQPQHQHFVSVGSLEAALADRGFDVEVEQRGEPHQPVDLVFAVWILLNRVAPPDVPWRAAPGPLGRLWRGVAFAVAVPLLVVALLCDRLLAPLARRRGWSNTYRVLARRAGPRPDVIDLREPRTAEDDPASAVGGDAARAAVPSRAWPAPPSSISTAP